MGSSEVGEDEAESESESVSVEVVIFFGEVVEERSEVITAALERENVVVTKAFDIVL